jgi:hypothetical protein
LGGFANNSTPQQWSSEKGEAPCHCCLLKLLVTTTPDLLADQGGHAAHQGLRPDATPTDLGQRRSEKAASFIAFWRLVWIMQITQGVAQLRQQGGGAGAMKQRKDQAAATADQQRPAQGKAAIQALEYRISPEQLAQAADPTHHNSHTGAAQGSG